MWNGEGKGLARNLKTSSIELHVQVTFRIDHERYWACTGIFESVGHVGRITAAIISLCIAILFDAGKSF